MNDVKENFALLDYNTFHVTAYARYFIEITDAESVKDVLASHLTENYPHFVLGGGSNVLFTQDFAGTIIHPVIKGIEKTGEDKETVTVRAGAGEDWDDLVEYCVNNEWGGIENLSLIPGTVGACPVQNIGAYGLEIKDFIDSVEGYVINSHKKIRLSANDCHFAYRDSIFKRDLKDQVLITHVSFRLYKNHMFNTEYPDLRKELDQYSETTIRNIRQAVITIRKNKLPDPGVSGNAGSFFKNPVVTKEKSHALLRFYPAMPCYKQSEGFVKLSAAWLIEHSGWKGRNCGKAGTHKKQPLILINRGGATGAEILQCAQKIQKSVMNHFAIKLEVEVSVL